MHKADGQRNSGKGGGGRRHLISVVEVLEIVIVCARGTEFQRLRPICCQSAAAAQGVLTFYRRVVLTTSSDASSFSKMGSGLGEAKAHRPSPHPRRSGSPAGGRRPARRA